MQNDTSSRRTGTHSYQQQHERRYSASCIPSTRAFLFLSFLTLYTILPSTLPPLQLEQHVKKEPSSDECARHHHNSAEPLPGSLLHLAPERLFAADRSRIGFFSFGRCRRGRLTFISTPPSPLPPPPPASIAAALCCAREVDMHFGASDEFTRSWPPPPSPWSNAGCFAVGQGRDVHPLRFIRLQTY